MRRNLAYLIYFCGVNPKHSGEKDMPFELRRLMRDRIEEYHRDETDTPSMYTAVLINSIIINENNISDK